MLLGVDTSTYLDELEYGARYYVGGKELDALDVFRSNGVEYVRLRLWNDPYSEKGEPYLAGTCDLDRVIMMARIAADKGYKILLDIHYSDFWVDPQKQFVPKAWAGLDIEKLSEKVYSFTCASLSALKNNGIDVPMVQIGNEITNGMLWTVGKITEDSTGKRTNYRQLARLLKEGIAAARSVYPDIKCVIHLERSYAQAIYAEYFDKLNEYAVDYDIIGMSYYPYWHGSFDEFFANVSMCSARFCKPIIVAEVAYAFTLEDYIKTEGGRNNLVVNEKNADSFACTRQYAISPEGQCAFVTDFLRCAKENNILGVFYWEPAWIPKPGTCWASEAAQIYINETQKETRNEWANQCLFDYDGNKLPACDAFCVAK